MKFHELTTSATRALNRVGFQLKKHSPEILVVAGVIGTITSAVMACKATTKLHNVLDETKNNIDMVHKGVEDGEVIAIVDGEEMIVPYNETDAQKDLTIHYVKCGVNIAKLYAPAVILGAVSIAGILSGHHILRKRNLAIAAAYTAADTGFKKYRDRVVERFGDKMDKELLYNIKSKEIEETVINEDGTESTVKTTVEVADTNEVLGTYSFCFDELSTLWVRDAERNKFALLRQQDYANELLETKGVMCLNDVLDMVGLPRCRYGQTVGWVYDKSKVRQIDFGIFNIHTEANRNFVNGVEKSVWLNFNVEGDIIHAFAK